MSQAGIGDSAEMSALEVPDFDFVQLGELAQKMTPLIGGEGNCDKPEDWIEEIRCKLKYLNDRPEMIGVALVVFLFIYMGCFKAPGTVSRVLNHEYVGLGLFLLIGLCLGFQQTNLAVLLIVTFIVLKLQFENFTVVPGSLEDGGEEGEDTPVSYMEPTVERRVHFEDEVPEEDEQVDQDNEFDGYDNEGGYEMVDNEEPLVEEFGVAQQEEDAEEESFERVEEEEEDDGPVGIELGVGSPF